MVAVKGPQRLNTSSFKASESENNDRYTFSRGRDVQKTECLLVYQILQVPPLRYESPKN